MSIIKEIFVKIKAMDFLSGKAKKAADEIQRIPKEKTVELKAKDGISSVVSGITDSLGSIGGSVLGSFAGMFAGGLAVGAVQELGKAVGEVVTQLVDLGTETQKSISRLGAMKNLVTDSTEAYRMFNDVGRNTNYDLGAVQEMGVQLVNIGYSARNAADMIQLCADTAAGLGTEKKLLLLFLLLLLSWWLYSAPATCWASNEPKTYTITETQLNTLERNLNLLDQILAQQDPELTTLQLQLVESKKELTMLRNELATSKEQLKKAEDSLRNANLYLEKCAQEEKRTRLRIKAQRNFWEAVAACLVVGLVVK